MKHNRSPAGRTPRMAPLAAALLAGTLLAAPLTASAAPAMVGGNVYYTGGDVTIDLLYNGTAYDEVLQLRSALACIDIVGGSQTGSSMTLTAQQLAEMGIGVGDELQFGIHVRDTGHEFFLGSGDRNADGFAHAYVRHSPSSGVYVGFEDLYGGGDRDYNDTIFRFSSGTSTTAPRREALPENAPAGSVPEPSGLLLMISGIGLLGVCVHRR